MLNRTEHMAQEGANTAAVEALQVCRRSAFLQGTGFIAGLSTSFMLLFVAGSDPFRSMNGIRAYIAAQCVNSVVNVVGAILLSKAYELITLQPSALPPALSLLRWGCNCRWSYDDKHQDDGEGKGSEWEAKTGELAGRGISLSNLLGFYKALGGSIMTSFQPAVHTTNDVVRLGIIPHSAASCSSYAQLVNNGKKAWRCCLKFVFMWCFYGKH